VLNDWPASLVNLLLIRILNEHCLTLASDGLVTMVWCKHGLQRRRSNFNGKVVRF